MHKSTTRNSGPLKQEVCINFRLPHIILCIAIEFNCGVRDIARLTSGVLELESVVKLSCMGTVGVMVPAELPAAGVEEKQPPNQRQISKGTYGDLYPSCHVCRLF